jgi:hypothetical protein
MHAHAHSIARNALLLLQVLCQEAVHAHAHSIACDALLLLHEAAMRGEDLAGMSEACILRNHIR